MDANMSAFKRRFNKALLELGNSQASCTARRLVGQTIQAMEKRTVGDKRSMPNISLSASKRPIIQVQQQQQQRRHFRYTFAPTSQHNNNGQQSAEFLASNGGCRRQQMAGPSQPRLEHRQNHGRTEPEAVKYRQYYDELSYQDDESENNLPGWSLVSELRPRRHTNQVDKDKDDFEDDYFDVEYLATKEKVDTMLPTTNLPTEFSGQVQADVSHQLEEEPPEVDAASSINDQQQKSTSFSRAHQNRSSVRSLRRRSAKFRQVRFQPIPQSIDISQQSVESAASSSKSTKTKLSYKPKHLKRKITRKLNSNLSHMNAQLNKITLKGFNNLAHRLQQTINSSRSMSGKYCKDIEQVSVSSHINVDEDNNQADEDDIGWGSDFDDQSAESSLTISGQPTELEIGKVSQNLAAVSDVIHSQGICGQFKRLDTSANDIVESFESIDGLEITSSEQPMKGQPEPLETPSLSPEGAEISEICCSIAGSSDDDEADLRSLEKRQGFKHIRDKLKIIFDQRLAASSSSGQTSGGQLQQSGASDKAALSSSSDMMSLSSSSRLATRQSESRSQEAVREEGKPPTGDQVDGVCDQLLTDEPVGQQSDVCGHRFSDSSVGSATKAAPAKVAIACGGQTAAAATTYGEFDCQSHCSYDSNHSGSQDSGHSTQHSAYSAVSSAASLPSSLMNHRHLASSVGSPEEEEEEEATTHHENSPNLSPSISPAEVAKLSAALAGGDDPSSAERQSQQDKIDERQERRSRFMQNRSIINNKLESMFRSRSGGGGGCSSLTEQPTQQVNKDYKEVSAPSSEEAAKQAKLQQPQIFYCEPTTTTITISLPGTTTATMLMNRQKLLEQQREMSLKLKQKPRRKAATRSHWANQNIYNNLNTLRPETKPITTVSSSVVGQSDSGLNEEAIKENSSYGFRPTMSLRQLVTDLIDDYERPPLISTRSPICNHDDDADLIDDLVVRHPTE